MAKAESTDLMSKPAEHAAPLVPWAPINLQVSPDHRGNIEASLLSTHNHMTSLNENAERAQIECAKAQFEAPARQKALSEISTNWHGTARTAMACIAILVGLYLTRGLLSGTEVSALLGGLMVIAGGSKIVKQLKQAKQD